MPDQKICLNNSYTLTLLNSSGTAIKELNSNSDLCTNGTCGVSFQNISIAGSANYSVEIVSGHCNKNYNLGTLNFKK